MNRRRFFQIFSGLSVAALPGWRWSEGRGSRERVAVAGGGIVGAAIAYHLARRGASVTLFEKEAPAAGATRNSFAWINATFSKEPRHYFELNRLGMEAWRHIEREFAGALQVKWGGSLEWYGEVRAAQELRQQVRRHQQWGYPVHLLDEAAFARLEPNVVPGPVLAASHSGFEGAVDPVHAVEVYLQKAREAGARVECPSEIEGVDLRWGRLAGIRTTRGSFETDVLVIACGVDTPRLAALAGIEVPLKDSPGLLAHTEPCPELVQRVVLAPGAHLKQTRDGRVVTGVGFGGTLGTDSSRENGERMLKEAERFLPQLKSARLDRVTLGWRPLPRDGYPVVGFTDGSPDVYLAVMHSGITLSGLIGRLAAVEILDSVRVDLLEPYRLSRFQTPVS
jgi:glycine/D-amino acid oxidase-like deaminating enzyme